MTPGGQRSPRDFGDLRLVDHEYTDPRKVQFSELRGDYTIEPGAARVTFADERLGLTITMDVAARGGDLVADAVTVRRTGNLQPPSMRVTDPGAPGVTGSDLRNVPVASYLTYVLTHPAVFHVMVGNLATGASSLEGPIRNPDAAGAQRRRSSDDRLDEVVTTYQRMLGDPAQRHRAATATAQTLNLSRSYVMRLLARARNDQRYARLFPTKRDGDQP